MASAVRKVCVIGGGTMGRGIVAAFLNANYNVTAVEQNEKALDIMKANVSHILSNKSLGDNLSCSVGLPTSDAGSYDMFVEAVNENLELKKSIFSYLDKVAKPDALLATNTSTLSITEIASATHRPESVIGMHFFNPSHKNPLLEIVLGEHTKKAVEEAVCQIGSKLGKYPTVVKNCPGFVANRMCFPYFEGVRQLIAEGMLPYTIDSLLESFGFAIGPCKMQDLIGLDLILDISKENGWTLEKGALPELVQRGRLGRKTGKGWYLFDPVHKKQCEDQEVVNIVHANSHRGEINCLSQHEVIEHTMYPLVNEAFRIIDEKIVKRFACRR